MGKAKSKPKQTAKSLPAHIVPASALWICLLLPATSESGRLLPGVCVCVRVCPWLPRQCLSLPDMITTRPVGVKLHGVMGRWKVFLRTGTENTIQPHSSAEWMLCFKQFQVIRNSPR